jgi:hypothetical protein
MEGNGRVGDVSCMGKIRNAYKKFLHNKTA